MNVVLVLSGGTGMRLRSGIPKQYILVEGRPVIAYCVETLALHDQIDAIQIVAAPAWQGQILEWLEGASGDDILWGMPKESPDPTSPTERLVKKPRERSWKILFREKFRGFSVPGENRQLSILHGLEDIRRYAGEGGVVLIHDAARPLLSAGQISECLEKMKGHDGLMPVLPMKDTIYTSMDGGKRVSGLLDRSTVYAGQAPEVFQIGRYLKVNRKLLPEQILTINGSTEPAILDGMDIAMIPGDEGNFKITTKGDLEWFCRMMEEKERQR